MANISTFELLVKRIAPLVGNPLIDAPFRRAVQGYFLTISNPNDRDIFFRIRARIPVIDPASPDRIVQRELINGSPADRNHIYTYDITGGPENGQLVYEPMRCRRTTFGGSQRTFVTRNLRLPPGQTAAYKLLPDIVSPTVNLPEPALEIRGYLEFVQLDSFIIIIRPDGTFELVSVDAAPADLLFTPEIRGTFLDNNYPGGADLDFDQIAYAMPTSTGGAQMTITESESLFLICNLPFILDPADLSGSIDFSGRVVLDEKTLKKIDAKVKKHQKIEPDQRFELKDVAGEIEATLNQLERRKK